MKLESDTIELIQAEMMKRVFEPVDDDVPDPSCYFEACLALLSSRVQQQIKAIPKSERHDWFIDRAMAMHGWCERAKAPDALAERIAAWLTRLLKTRPPARGRR
jgi:hypothetical protein